MFGCISNTTELLKICPSSKRLRQFKLSWISNTTDLMKSSSKQLRQFKECAKFVHHKSILSSAITIFCWNAVRFLQLKVIISNLFFNVCIGWFSPTFSRICNPSASFFSVTNITTGETSQVITYFNYFNFQLCFSISGSFWHAKKNLVRNINKWDWVRPPSPPSMGKIPVYFSEGVPNSGSSLRNISQLFTLWYAI